MALGGSDPAFCVIWSRFGQLRRYLAYKLDEEDRIYRLNTPPLGPLGMGPCISLLAQLWRSVSHGIRNKLVGLGMASLSTSSQ